LHVVTVRDGFKPEKLPQRRERLDARKLCGGDVCLELEELELDLE
jgi:hypothetical protein